MKAKELIPHGLYKKGKSIVRITAIDIVADACRGIDISNGEDTGWFPSDKLSPIPLTPEILEKNGFTEGEESNLFNYWEENFELEHPLLMQVNVKFRNLISTQITRDHWGDCIQISGNTINYVHELQHALRLCGLDDLADNFKVE